MRLEMTTDFFDFGVDVDIVRPPPSEVADPGSAASQAPTGASDLGIEGDVEQPATKGEGE